MDIPGNTRDYSSDISQKLLTLYRAGVLVGDEYGYFSPYKPLTRAEAAVIISRIIRPEMRIKLNDGKCFSEPADKPNRINFDTYYKRFNRRNAGELSFTGDAIHYRYNDESKNETSGAVFLLDGSRTITFTYPYINAYNSIDDYEYYFYKSVPQDGMFMYKDVGGTFQIYTIEGELVETEAQRSVYDATPFNQGLAAVRFDPSMDGIVNIIDKNEKIVKQVPGGTDSKLIAIFADIFGNRLSPLLKLGDIFFPPDGANGGVVYRAGGEYYHLAICK